MPRVSEAQPNQVRTQVGPGPRASSVGEDAFGAGIGRGLQQAAVAAGNIVKRIDTNAAEEAMTAFERQKNDLFFNKDTGYFKTQGRNAYDNADDVTKALNKLKKDFGKGLSQAAQNMFNKVADRHISSGTRDIARHASDGIDAWEIATIGAKVENSLETATLNWNDPHKVKVQRALGRQAIHEKAAIQGITGVALNEQLENFESAIATGIIQSATANSASAGRLAMKEHGSQLEGGLKAKWDAKIKTKAKAEYTSYTSSSAVAIATSLVAGSDDRGFIIERINEIEDTDIRKKTMKEAMYQLNQKKTAEAEAVTESFQDAENDIISGGSVDSWISNNPEEWEALLPDMKRSLLKGETAKTDFDIFYELMSLPPEEMKNLDLNKHSANLGTTERTIVRDAISVAKGINSSKSDKTQSQAGRSRGTQTTDIIFNLFGAKAKRNEATRLQVEEFYDLLNYRVNEKEAETGKGVTADEFTEIVMDLNAKVVKERIFFLPNTTLNITSIPAEAMPELRAKLIEKGVPVTSQALIQLWDDIKDDN